MPERLRPEFGDADYIPQRTRYAAEYIRNTIKLSFKDDAVWEDGKNYFPEQRSKMVSIRRTLQRRQELFSSQNLVTSNEFETLTQFSYALSNAILINRLYPDCFPLTIDEGEKEKIVGEAKKMIDETNGLIISKEPGKLDELIIFALDGTLKLGPQSEISPGQLSLKEAA
jgi:hypothetical protein